MSLAAVPRKIAQPVKQRVVVLGRNRPVTGDPGIEIGLRRLGQAFEGIELGLRQRGDRRIGEAPHDQVHLAGATMPRAEQQSPPPLVQALARSRGSSQLMPPNAESPDGPGDAHIGGNVPDVSGGGLKFP